MDLKYSTALALLVGFGLALPTSAQVAAQAAEADIEPLGVGRQPVPERAATRCSASSTAPSSRAASPTLPTNR